MLKILDGRECFYQWDSNRQLVISDLTVDEVHFCNKTDDCSLVCEVYEQDGARVVDVPNILLQEAWTIRAYAYCNGCYTKQSATFKVLARTKPTDYIYTETEVKTWQALESRVEALEQGGTGGGCDCDLTQYYTKTETDTAFASKDYVSNAIANIDTGDAGAEAFIFTHTRLNQLTDREKEVAIELYNSAKETGVITPKYTVYFTGGGFASHPLHSCSFSNNYLYIDVQPTTTSTWQYVIKVNDAGELITFDFYNQQEQSANKDWKWQEDSNLGILGREYSHIKVVGYFDGITDYMATFDISAYNNNYLYEESGARYFVPNVYGIEDKAILMFYNNGDYLELRNFDTGSGVYFTPLGYFYWG